MTGFGIGNLPYGIFSTDDAPPRVGMRWGDRVLDLHAVLHDDVFSEPSLNAFMEQGRGRWDEVREKLVSILADGEVPESVSRPVETVQMHLPFEVADFVDFYASEHHASNLGRLFRPDAPPLLPNWKYLPVGYHGRSSTVVVSGTDIVRPCGQRKLVEDQAPSFGPTRTLDIEAELGFVVGVPTEQGQRVAPDDFADHVFGAVVLNDWSARDIQAWEYVPLGPFLGKSFATSMSPWVVPLAALEPARRKGPVQAPEPLPYLCGAQEWGLNVEMKVSWNGQEVSRPSYSDMYWSPAQMLAHLTANGASLRVGDLFGSGTVSGPNRDTWGALVEISDGGTRTIEIGGSARTFLEDGDEVTISAVARGSNGTDIDFGEVRGRIVPARL